MATSRADPFLGLLAGGISFDKKRFARDISLFKPQVASPAAAAADGGAAGSAGGGKKRRAAEAAAAAAPSAAQRKRARKHAAAARDAPGATAGLDVFRAGSAAALAAVPQQPAVSPAAASEQEAAALLRKAHRIRVAGGDAPPPLRAFADLEPRYGAAPALVARLAAEGWAEPTPVQRQAIPAMLEGHELLAVAQTGSGKTLAFLLPLVLQLKAHESGGVRAVVLSPTRELASQTLRVLRRLSPGKRLRGAVLTKAAAAGADFDAVDILVATPLRLGRLLEAGRISLARVTWLVMDEADKLFELGFLEQIDAVVAACNSENVRRALFSATLPEAVETLARSVMASPLRLTVGERGAAAASVEQRLLFCGNEPGKLLALRQLLRGGGLRPPAVLFVQSKERAKDLLRELAFEQRARIGAVHADMSQAKRDAAVDAFRRGDTWVLIATDLMARGMDFVGVNTVINYDFPSSPTQYVHRVGRSGRAGRTGEAVTFFTEEDAPQLRAIANVMRASGCDVPPWMLTLHKGPKSKSGAAPQRAPIGTGAKFDRLQARKKRSMVEASKRRTHGDGAEAEGEDASDDEAED